jgi:hypothetical protein
MTSRSFVYKLNPKIRAMVRMWKPSLVVEAIERSCYIEELLGLKGGMRFPIPQQPGYVGKAPRPSPGEEVLGHLLMETELHLDHCNECFNGSKCNIPGINKIHASPINSQGSISRDRGSRGRNSSHRPPQRNIQIPPHITCWGCKGPHYQCDCPKSQSGTMHKEGKTPMGRENSNHQIYATMNNHQEEHQSTVVESSGMINHVKVKILFDYGATDSFISPYALEKCGLAAYEHDEFKQVEMDSGEKQVVGPSVDKCFVNT